MSSELHESKFPSVSRIEFIRSKLSNFSAHVSGVTDWVSRPGAGRGGMPMETRWSWTWITPLCRQRELIDKLVFGAVHINWLIIIRRSPCYDYGDGHLPKPLSGSYASMITQYDQFYQRNLVTFIAGVETE